jgi:hypothetical protein
MSQKLWVQHNTTGKIFIDKVSIQGCEDVDDFLKEIKKSPFLQTLPSLSTHLMELQKSNPLILSSQLETLGRMLMLPLLSRLLHLGNPVAW